MVLMALLGAAVALGVAAWRNRNIEPLFEAVAPVSVLRLEDEPEERFERRVETVVSQARSTVASQLADPDLQVSRGEAGGVVEFTAVAAESGAALGSASDLRSAYLDARPSGTGEQQLAPILDALAAEITVVEAELRELRGSAATGDVVIEAERQALQAQITSAAQEAVSLRAQLLDPSLTDEERNTADTRLEIVEGILESIGPQLADLPLPERTQQDTASRLNAMVLERRLRDLESRYVATALRGAEVGNEGLVGEAFVVDRTGDELSPLVAAVAGLAAGALFGTVGIVAGDRIGRPIRTVDDVAGIPLIPVQKAARAGSSFGWYESAPRDPRRVDIQSVRAHVDQVVQRGGLVVVGGTEPSTTRDAHDLAVDLSSSFAATGKSVLYIDADFDHALEVPDSGSSLGELIRSQASSLPDRSDVKSLLLDRPEVIPGLRVVTAGSAAGDPIDWLAGPAFDVIVDEARQVADVVVLSGSSFGTPAGETLASSASLAILAAQKDKTRGSDLMATVSRLRDLGVSAFLGALLGARTPGVGRLSKGRRSRGRG